MFLTFILPILKIAGGPVIVFILRQIAKGGLDKLPAATQPIVAALINVLIAIFTGVDPVMSLTTLVDAIKVFIEGLGVVKGIDVLKGKAAAISDANKALLRRINT